MDRDTFKISAIWYRAPEILRARNTNKYLLHHRAPSYKWYNSFKFNNWHKCIYRTANYVCCWPNRFVYYRDILIMNQYLHQCCVEIWGGWLICIWRVIVYMNNSYILASLIWVLCRRRSLDTMSIMQSSSNQYPTRMDYSWREIQYHSQGNVLGKRQTFWQYMYSWLRI